MQRTQHRPCTIRDTQNEAAVLWLLLSSLPYSMRCCNLTCFCLPSYLGPLGFISSWSCVIHWSSPMPRTEPCQAHCFLVLILIASFQYSVCWEVKPKSTESASTAFIHAVQSVYVSTGCSLRPCNYWRRDLLTILELRSCGRGRRTNSWCSCQKFNMTPWFSVEEKYFQLEVITLFRDKLLQVLTLV